MSVTITLRGRHYTVRSDEDSREVVAVAEWLDGKLSDMSARTRGADGETVALLVALNLASDFQRFRKEVLRDLEGADRRLQAVGALLASPSQVAPVDVEPQPAADEASAEAEQPAQDPDPSSIEDPTDLPVAASLEGSED